MSRRPPQLGHSGLPLGLFLLLRSQPPRPQTGRAGSGAGLLLRSGGRRSPALFLLDELSSDVCWGLGLEQGAVKRETDIKRGKWTEAKRNAAKFFFLFHSVREIPQNRGLRHIPTPRPCCHMAGQVTGSPRRAHPWPPRPHPGCPRRRNEAGCGDGDSSYFTAMRLAGANTTRCCSNLFRQLPGARGRCKPGSVALSPAKRGHPMSRGQRCAKGFRPPPSPPVRHAASPAPTGTLQASSRPQMWALPTQGAPQSDFGAVLGAESTLCMRWGRAGAWLFPCPAAGRAVPQVPLGCSSPLHPMCLKLGAKADGHGARHSPCPAPHSPNSLGNPASNSGWTWEQHRRTHLASMPGLRDALPP